MFPQIAQFWIIFGLIAQFFGAIASATAALWLAGRRDRLGKAGNAMIAALFFTAIWSLSVAVTGDENFSSSLTESMRNLAWFVVLYRLFASDGRHTSLAPIRPVIYALGFVEVINLGFILIMSRISLDPQLGGVAFHFMSMLRLLVTVGALMLVHNLYAGASRQSRLALRWPAAGLAALWMFDLNLYTIAYLSNVWPVEIASSRGISAVILAGMFAVGATKNREVLRLKPSRAVTFQTLSLLVIAAYLVAMVAIAQWLSYAGGDFARLMELGFLTVASALALLVLPSHRLRGWLKVTLAKHFFQHRYDYREEWLRFTHTIGHSGEEALPLSKRVVQAVADIAECPGGLLLTPGDHGDLTLAARWNWPEAEVPAAAFPARSIIFFESEGFIADLDDIRAGDNAIGEADYVPQWLCEESRAWALVPLIHYDRLVGMIVLARPQPPRKFDWEDFDLLRVVGQQLASYLAENAGQEALAEASRFDDFHRRIAFVMHDIKNLASQLSLLARNAEIHAEKKEFRDDMLVTLRNSSDKLNALLARLSRYGKGGVDKLEEVSATEVVSAVVQRFGSYPQVLLAEITDCTITANRHSLEQVLTHLVQNAVDASEADSPVFISLTVDGFNARIEVIDSGCGMTAEFVRSRLFKPFVSTKEGGFGIGAYEARELVQAMRGRLEVESREGLGSRFVVRIPLSAASDMYQHLANDRQREAS